MDRNGQICETVTLFRDLTRELKERSYRVMEIIDQISEESDNLRLAAVKMDYVQQAYVSVEYWLEEVEKNLKGGENCVTSKA